MQFYLKYLQVQKEEPVLFLVSPKNFSPFFKTPSQAFAIHFHSPTPSTKNRPGLLPLPSSLHPESGYFPTPNSRNSPI
jgi:hypothetical protein